ncbi:MAG: sigma 54-interacting transcriptional regulator [Candidatus Magnetomorum sp.]|nr:sigma 54-interacting transcriptional regulator [Candidatus Magnetomorum sp.]
MKQYKDISNKIPNNSMAIILESISDGVFTVDKNWRITSFNRAAEEITDISKKDAIGVYCCEVFRSNMCNDECALRQTIETGKPIVNKLAFIINAKGKRIPISVSTALLRDDTGQVVGGAETFRDLSLVEELRRELKAQFQIGDIISQSPAMKQFFDILPQISASESSVLIQGETGTGKELTAKAIHNLSYRKNKPFIALNCGALPDNLLESELFGYKTGAFTGATMDKPGRFALAEGGTLFLDEIGEVSKALQVRLLRVLQEKTYEPLGGTKTIHANVRIIAATNRDLSDLVKLKKFRQDLFYRINVVKIELPSLRKRKEDIPLLIDHFIKRFNRFQSKSITGICQEAMSLLLAHDYPGNIRELENIIEHAFVLCHKGDILLNHLPDDFVTDIKRPLSESSTITESIRAVEIQGLLDILKRNNYNRLATARELGIHKTTLFRKLKKLGIKLPETDGRSSRQ